jgi:tRNA (cmo5U34)-methyltransferase
VSSLAPTAGWQNAAFVAHFADRRQLVLPLIDLQEDLIRRLLCGHGRSIRRFLDLGAGAGAMTELVFATHPDSEAVLIDFSKLMLEHASRRLAGSAGRWRSIHGDLADPAWRERLPAGHYDAIVSGLAIHHLSSARKRALFKELFALLEPGGIVVNMDYVAIVGPLRRLFDKQMRANAIRAEHESGGTRSEDDIQLDDGEDQPDTVEDQLRWLRAAGFEQVEVHFKWAEAAIFGGVRAPAPDGTCCQARSREPGIMDLHA